MKNKILLIDNYDSFVYNLFQYLSELGADVIVKRNDKISEAEAKSIGPTHLVISPGPGRPETDAKMSNTLIKYFAGKIPILGVCLGHQAIGHVFGAKITHASVIMHGKTSQIYHDSKTIFQGLTNPFDATRYHSLVIQEENLPGEFEISAHTSDGEVMGIRHKQLPIEGVQFHPESIMTKLGKNLLQNFLNFK